MKLDSETLTVLKNYATINPHILVREGNVLSTMAPSKGVLARAVVPAQFNKSFAISNLSRLLNVISLFDDPEIEFDDQFLRVFEKGKSVKYFYAAENLVKSPAKTEVELKSVYASFELRHEDLTQLLKAMNTLGLTEIAVIGDGQDLTVTTLNSREMSSNAFLIKMGDTDKNFRIVWRAEFLKLMPINYHITIDSAGITHWKGENIDYWIPVDPNYSYFN